jgi:hypothetical protein
VPRLPDFGSYARWSLSADDSALRRYGAEFAATRPPLWTEDELLVGFVLAHPREASVVLHWNAEEAGLSAVGQ